MTAAACVDTTTSLSPADALEVLDPFFEAMREEFIEAGISECSKTRLYCAPSVHDSPRHFAATRDDGLVMLVAPELAELDARMVAAIFAHEFGHATDFLYPGEFALGRGRKVIRRSRSELGSHWARWIKSWEQRDSDTVEFTADAIAEWVTGRRIGYVGPCLVQAFDRGRARPRGLR